MNQSNNNIVEFEQEPDLEQDLYKSSKIKQKCENIEYAEKLYGALCNSDWKKRTDPNPLTDWKNCWSCTFRYAGEIIANIRNVGEDYLDFYLLGNYAELDEEIVKDIEELDWVLIRKE